MKNSADQRKCYPLWLKAEVDNTLQDLQNSSYPIKAAFNNNCFFIQNIFKLIRDKMSSLFSAHHKEHNIVPRFCQSKVQWSAGGCTFDVILMWPVQISTCSRLHFWRHWFNMKNYFQIWSTAAGYGKLCNFNKSERRKYFDWIIKYR